MPAKAGIHFLALGPRFRGDARQDQLSRKLRSLRDRDGCLSFLKAFASIPADAHAPHRELLADFSSVWLGIHGQSTIVPSSMPLLDGQPWNALAAVRKPSAQAEAANFSRRHLGSIKPCHLFKRRSAPPTPIEHLRLLPFWSQSPIASATG
jgi:hypothetical protein